MASTSSSGSTSPAPSPSKKSKTSKASQPIKPPLQSTNYTKDFETDRAKTAKSILEFNFRKRRIRILSQTDLFDENKNGVLYWMSRDARVQDNWAMLFAQKVALKNEVPLHICFCLVPKFLDATIRHYKFMLAGLQEIEQECTRLNIAFHLLLGPAATHIPKFVQENRIGAVICDFSPLRVPLAWLDEVKRKLPDSVALCQVDAHNIVPVWVASDKQEYAARTIRTKINGKLDEFLTGFPPVIRHPYDGQAKPSKVNWSYALASVQVNRTVDQVHLGGARMPHLT